MRAREQPPRAMQEGDRPRITINIASALWQAEPDARAILRRVIIEAACATAMMRGEVAVVLTDDAEIRRLNRVWRNKDRPTNVLSFPAPAAAPATSTMIVNRRARSTSRVPKLLGDIVIAYETTDREARVEQKLFAHHLAHLAVHGFLHLLGYDHEIIDEAEAMEALETAILARLDVPDPYGDA